MSLKRIKGYISDESIDIQNRLFVLVVIISVTAIDNTNGDKFGLVTVIYSLVLFLLGIVGIFRRLPNRVVVFGISIVFLVIATIYMLTIPLPTDFSFTGYFMS